jgi:undecaprenyl diphosphate synthase
MIESGNLPSDNEEGTLLAKIDLKKLPVHVAVIMDGNGRWAKNRGLNRMEGHKAGTVTAREIATAASDLGIRFLTVYTFSSENWKRSVTEVNALMKILYDNLVNQTDLLIKNRIRVKTLGDLGRLPGKLRKKLIETEELTDKHRGLQVNMALNYGSRQEIIQAVKGIVADGVPASRINENLFKKYLYGEDIPDPDLLIRTSGELRISNFLLYQIAYSELYFTPTLWPDFKPPEFYRAIIAYQQRQRRFGSA